jgi:hypothetical protein
VQNEKEKRNGKLQVFKSSHQDQNFGRFKQNITYNKTLHKKSKTKAKGKMKGLDWSHQD